MLTAPCRMVVRIMVMVPIYAVSSLISLFSVEAAFYIDAIRDIYEVCTVCLTISIHTASILWFFFALWEHCRNDWLTRFAPRPMSSTVSLDF